MIEALDFSTGRLHAFTDDINDLMDEVLTAHWALWKDWAIKNAQSTNKKPRYKIEIRECHALKGESHPCLCLECGHFNNAHIIFKDQRLIDCIHAFDHLKKQKAA